MNVALVSVTLAVLVLVPGLGHAQVSIEAGPSLGLYLPLREYEGPPPGYVPWPEPEPIPGVPSVPAFPTAAPTANWTQRNAAAFGAELGAWFGDRWGVAASWRRMASAVVHEQYGIPPQGQVGGTVQVDGTVQVVTGEVQLLLGNPERQFRMLLTGGLAWVGRSGPAFAGVESADSWGGVLGVGSRIRLNDRLALNARLRGLIYGMQLTAFDATYPSSTQVDLLGEVGLMVRVF